MADDAVGREEDPEDGRLPRREAETFAVRSSVIVYVPS